MKIAFLSFYNGKIDRGVEVATIALINKLQQKHNITLFQSGNNRNFQITTEIITVNCDWRSDTSNSWWRKFYLDYFSLKILYFTLKFIPFFIKNKYDLVIPTNGGWQVVLIRIITWVFGKKMLVQGNAGIGRDDLWQLMCIPNYYIAISIQGFNFVKNKFPWIRKTYIPYGVNINEIANTKAIRLKLKSPVILCVAAFFPYKRIDLVIKAVSLIKKANLLVIGQGPLENELNQLGQRLLNSRFQLLTAVGHNDLLKYYKSADVFTLPSLSSEAFGIVYVEAMAANLPVVATDDINRQEIIGNAGILVNPENIEEYAKGLEKALTNKFGNKPVEQAKLFSWDKIANRYEEIISQL